MRYGVPYKGSKNGIAEWVYSHFPKRDNFYDLFAGGCAITQIALMKSRFKKYVCNDIDNGGITLFLNAIHGKYKNETRWISREDFFRLKDSEPYIKYCWSFGNAGRCYLYSQKLEPYKKAWHYAIFFNDFSLSKKLGVDLSPIEPIKSIYKRYIASKRILANFSDNETKTRSPVIEQLQQLEALARLQQLEALARLQRLQQLEALAPLQPLQSFSLSYDEVKIDKNSVIYCDIPYRGTNGYGNSKTGDFDYEKFYSWAERQTEPCFISEYWLPEDRFECVAEIEKQVTLCSGGGKSQIEKLFVPKSQIKMIRAISEKRYRQLEFDFN